MPGSAEPEWQQCRRLGTRRSVGAVSARWRVSVPGRRGRVKSVVHEVAVQNVSVTGAGLLVPAEAARRPGTVVHMELAGDWGRVQIASIRPSEDPAFVLCGVEFVDPNPAFLPEVDRLLGRGKDLGVPMRD